MSHPKTIKDLKAMMSEASSKKWFKKHGTPKHEALERKGSKEYKKYKIRGNNKERYNEYKANVGK
jgi:hypothetical protein